MSVSRKDLERDEVRRAIDGLLNTANRYSVTHLEDPLVRYYFKREYIFLGQCLKHDYENGILIGDKVVRLVKQERQSLRDQAAALAEFGIGVIAGAGQVAAGVATCTAESIFSFSGMALCGGVGMPTLLHGANNLYENAYKITGNLHQNWIGQHTGDYKDVTGLLKDGYRLGGKKIGLNNRDSDAAYAAVDLATSAYGLAGSRKVAEKWSNMPDSKQFKLYRYSKIDYEKGWRTMSGGSLLTEMSANVITLKSVKDSYKGEEKGANDNGL